MQRIILPPSLTIAAVARKLDGFSTTLRQAGLPHVIIFNSVYLTITRNVQRRLDEFSDPSFLSRFDRQFAKYYLRAVEQYTLGHKPSLPWQIAFERDLNRRKPLAKLALGVNAHITHDIALALKDTGAQPVHYMDYKHVNHIIFDSTDEIIQTLPYRWCRYKIMRWPLRLAMMAVTTYWRRLAWREFIKLSNQKINKQQLQDRSGRRALRLNRIPF